MLDRRTQMQRVVRRAFTRPVPLAILILGILLLWSKVYLYGSVAVLLYLIISVYSMFSPKFVRKVVDES